MQRDTFVPSNYRPITVTGALSKMFERILSTQLTEYLEIHNIMYPCQFEFPKKYSALDALIYCTEFIRKSIDDSKTVSAALLYLSIAFDSIIHEVLMNNLQNLGL